VGALLPAAPARPCAPAPPPGRHVSILAEQALIVWEPAARRQHFIRRARFHSDAADFGFLVPTPSVPELAEAPDAVFDGLHASIQPEVVRRTGLRPVPFAVVLLPFTLFFMDRGVETGAAAGAPQMVTAPRVQVLEERRVAGYDAAVLQADDPAALMRWLEEHGYDARPELLAWLRPYVEQRYTVTAFKVAGSAGPSAVSTQAVRMTFAAERPFYPYREPEAPPSPASPPGPPPARELLVYVVAPQRMQGTLGEGAAAAPWPAEVPWAAPGRGLATVLAPALPAGAAPDAPWLTTFVDRASPRPGARDLFFAASAAQDAVVPPPIEIDARDQLMVPVDVLAGLVAGGWWWQRRRRARAAA
jgi:hypothetical protein